MKKVFCVILAVWMLLSMCACAAPSTSTTTPSTNITPATTEKDGRIELTLDNYKTYLSVDCWASKGGRYGYGSFYMYKTVEAGASSKGKSTNFNYYDIIIKIKYTITYDQYNWDGCFRSGTMAPTEYKIDKRDVEQTGTLTLTPEINGEGRVSGVEHRLPNDRWLDSISNVEYEIVSISGYVEPA